MATASVRQRTKDHPRLVTGVISLVGYAVVIGTFAGVVPLFPDVSRGTVIALSDAIAVVNALALSALLLGVRFIRRREIAKHRAAMLTAFALITLFLVLYLLKVGGGFEKRIVAPPLVTAVYLAMLVVHVLLSVLAVPVVLYAVVLGLTHTPAELADTNHARVGRVAVAAWATSLALGIVTYLLLNHVYAWEPLERGAVLVVAGLPVRRWRSPVSSRRR